MAAITISTPQDLINFCNGNMGTGSSSEYLTVTFTADVDFATLPNDNINKYNFQGSTQTFYANINGNGHRILNMAFSNSTNWQLFGTLFGSITSLTIKDLNVSLCAAFQGFCYNGSHNTLTLLDCHMVAHVFATGPISCLINSQGTAQIYQCSVNGEYETSGNVEIICLGRMTIARECQVKGKFNCSGTGTSRSIYLLGGFNSKNIACFAINVTVKGFNKLYMQNTYFCYVTFSNGQEIQDKGYTNSGFINGGKSTYYGNDEWTGGNNGVAKSQLQSQSWLRERGWAI